MPAARRRAARVRPLSALPDALFHHRVASALKMRFCSELRALDQRIMAEVPPPKRGEHTSKTYHMFVAAANALRDAPAGESASSRSAKCARWRGGAPTCTRATPRASTTWATFGSSALSSLALWHSGTLATPLSPRVGSTRRTITMVKPRRRAVKCCRWFVNNPPFYKVYSTDALLYPPRHTLLHHGPPRARHAAPLHRRRHLGRGSLCGWPGWPCSGLARAFRSAGSAAALWSPTGHFSGGAHTHT